MHPTLCPQPPSSSPTFSASLTLMVFGPPGMSYPYSMALCPQTSALKSSLPPHPAWNQNPSANIHSHVCPLFPCPSPVVPACHPGLRTCESLLSYLHSWALSERQSSQWCLHFQGFLMFPSNRSSTLKKGNCTFSSLSTDFQHLPHCHSRLMIFVLTSLPQTPLTLPSHLPESEYSELAFHLLPSTNWPSSYWKQPLYVDTTDHPLLFAQGHLFGNYLFFCKKKNQFFLYTESLLWASRHYLSLPP